MSLLTRREVLISLVGKSPLLTPSWLAKSGHRGRELLTEWGADFCLLFMPIIDSLRLYTTSSSPFRGNVIR